MLAGRAIMSRAAMLTFSQYATAGPCDVLISDIVERTGATFERFSPSGANAFLKHPLMDSFTVECDQPRAPRINAYWDRNAFPSNGFFSVVAAAGALVTSEKAERIESALRQCNRRALGDTSREMANIDVGAAEIDCHSFTRDGGGVGLSIRKRRRSSG
jgi:hypothetical protein